MTTPAVYKPATAPFALFQLTFDEDAYGEDLPIAVMIRLDNDLVSNIQTAVAHVESGLYSSLTLNIASENVRWISKLGFTSEGVVAPIEGWFNADTDALVCTCDIENIEMDGDRADFAEVCDVFDAEPIESQSITIEKFGNDVYVGPGGNTLQWKLASLMEQWPVIQARLTDAPTIESMPLNDAPRGA